MNDLFGLRVRQKLYRLHKFLLIPLPHPYRLICDWTDQGSDNATAAQSIIVCVEIAGAIFSCHFNETGRMTAYFSATSAAVIIGTDHVMVIFHRALTELVTLGRNKTKVCILERQMHLHLFNIRLECISNHLLIWEINLGCFLDAFTLDTW